MGRRRPRRLQPAARPGERVTNPWWRDAVCYQLYIRSFADSDGDGKGDLQGITDHLDHLVDLGVDALWLNPFYPSPQNDHGYDVSDFRDVEPAYGTLDDVDTLIHEAHARGLKLLADIVPNHTSSEHPWFQEALESAPGSPERDRYVFRPGRGRRRVGAAQQLALRVRRLGMGAGARRRVVPPPLRRHPARPQLAQPRGPRGLREDAAVLARPRCRRVPDRRRARAVQGGGASRRARP